MSRRPIDVAQHEAAHVVVGVALGLRLHRASAAPSLDGEEGLCLGYTWFPWGGTKTALSLMYSAGIAWEEIVGGDTHSARHDAHCVRELERSAAGARASLRAAHAVLAGLGVVHARVTRALLEHDLCGRDVLAIAHGERLSDGE